MVFRLKRWGSRWNGRQCIIMHDRSFDARDLHVTTPGWCTSGSPRPGRRGGEGKHREYEGRREGRREGRKGGKTKRKGGGRRARAYHSKF